MTYRVDLEIHLPDGLEAIEDDAFLDEAPFVVEVHGNSDGLLLLRCKGIEPAGAAKLPEALRLAQAGLSPVLKNHVPAFAAAGGLLWKFVAHAEVTDLADGR